MTSKSGKPKPTIFSERGTTRHFLFNPPAAASISGDSPLSGNGSIEALQQAFPEIHCGDAFLQYTTKQMQNVSCFGSMVIRMDGVGNPDNASDDDGDSFCIMDVSRVIDKLCRMENGIWGPVQSDSLGCFFSGKNDADTLKLAEEIQDRVEGLANGSVSIGVASYPTGDFNKEDVFGNAGKALTHASFFGTNSAVLFDAISLNISGDELYQKGDVSGAVKELESALKLDPENVNVLNSLGVCYGVEGSLEKALEVFSDASRLDSREVMALYNAGYVHSLLNQTEDALRCYQKAEVTGEDIFEVIFQLGKLYLGQGDLDAAKTYLEKAARLQPESWIAYLHLGECCEALHMTDEAVMHYETTVKKNPTDACALSALGVLYNEKSENPEISTLFCEKAVEMSPESGLFQFRLGKVYFHQEQPEKALSAFNKAMDLGYPAESEMAMAREHLARESQEI
ncbi:MAG: tetratricopeptide repeat protein [Desulfobacterales bacterium]|nr:tetratricopeptide repeat protein [Desulfobacterales bacterium]MDX2511052.1 tetratricopeptide repeat protein [Desulfobacterales bacterium]